MTGTARPAALTDPRAASVRKVVGLAGRAVRVKTGLTLVEGPQAVRELVACAPGALKDLYVTDEAAARWADIVAAAAGVTPWIHPVSVAVARRIAPAAQGIVAVARLGGFAATLPEAVAGEQPFLVVLPATQDPGNAGTIVRLADACGASAVIAGPGTVDLTSPKVVRASAGSVFHLSLVEGVALSEVAKACRERGIRLLGADGHADATVEEVLAEPTERIAWVFGNEARGLDAGEVAHLDQTAALAMWGRAESYNVASAAAICLYATAKARGR